jgi:hypothetical protein
MTRKSIHVFAALCLTACIDAEPTRSVDQVSIFDPTSDDTLVLTEVLSSAGARTSLVDPGFEAVGLPGSACACETPECVADWVTATLGCGLCIDLHCADGGSISVCVACETGLVNVQTDPSLER